MIQPQIILSCVCGVLLMASSTFAGEFQLRLRTQSEAATNSGRFESTSREASWSAEQTAVIVCDVWDYHHCLNAVRRLEEFAPRMNEVLIEARKRGATIIHSPSDCMTAYEQHPARKRASEAPTAKNKPRDIEHWCSRIPSEEKALYPVDQSDGGEDDDPTEHAAWAAKLKELGRNPGMPWKRQSDLITIDDKLDFISDRGDEVWNILEQRGIKNVILVGVHCNMCVLGRPFGLRQMARNGKQVVLMRDMTDSMYNPKRWPYVDHFTGNDLVISHVERFVCPTITSNQLLGGEPFRSKYDKREKPQSVTFTRKPQEDWSTISIPSPWSSTAAGVAEHRGVTWYRCVVRLPKSFVQSGKLKLQFYDTKDNETKAWLNGIAISADGTLPEEAIVMDDYNLLALRVNHNSKPFTTGIKKAPTIASSSGTIELKGRWQFRIGDDESWSNIPLPAKFGGSTDMLFEP